MILGNPLRKELTDSRSVFRGMRSRVPVTQCLPFDALHDIWRAFVSVDFDLFVI